MLLAVVASVGATVYTARPALDLQVEAVAFAIGAGALYGALPVLCRNAGRSPDIAAVALYLFYGTLPGICGGTLGHDPGSGLPDSRGALTD